jgi:hypothetical protein
MCLHNFLAQSNQYELKSAPLDGDVPRHPPQWVPRSPIASDCNGKTDFDFSDNSICPAWEE